MGILIGILVLIGIIWAISEIVEKHRQKVRNQLAHEVLDNDFDYTKEKNGILSIKEKLISITEKIKFLTPNITLNTSFSTDYPVYVRTFCPKCREGKLVKRKSTHGFFLGCSNYPKCRFIKNID